MIFLTFLIFLINDKDWQGSQLNNKKGFAMAGVKDDDKVTLKVEGVSRQARYFLNRLSGHEQEEDESTTGAVRGRIISRLIMEWSEQLIGPGVENIKEEFDYFEKQRVNKYSGDQDSAVEQEAPDDGLHL